MQEYAGVLVVVLGFSVLAPVVIAASKSHRTLSLAAVALCFCSTVGTCLTLIGSGLLAVAAVQPIFNSMWLASGIFAVGAFMTRQSDRRHEELMFRMLNNDAEYLKPPSILKKKYRH
jgi:hypothetical protein